MPDSGSGQSLELNSDAPIIINSEMGIQGDGVKDSIVTLAPNDTCNDNFTMGAPPQASAPGTIKTTMMLQLTDTAVHCAIKASPSAEPETSHFWYFHYHITSCG